MSGDNYPGPRHSVAPPASPNGASAGEPSIGQLVHNATQDVSTLIRGEIELAKLELKTSAKRGGVGVAFFVLAGALAIYAITFLLIAFAEGLVSLGIWRWAAYLIVFGVVLLVAIVLAFLGVRLVKKIKPPQQTIDTTRETVEYLRHPTQHPNVPTQPTAPTPKRLS